MANLFSSIVIPATSGSGASVNVSAMGADKLFSLSGVFDGTINIEASNDNTVWSPIASFVAPNDFRVSCASIYVRATLIGTSNSAVLSVGANDAGTAMTALTVPAANGTGAAANVSAYGSKKTFLYDGGMDGCLTIEMSQDAGTTYSQIASFVGRTPAKIDIDAVMSRVRVVVSGFVSGTGVISVCAEAPAGASAAPDQTVAFWGNTTIGPLASTQYLTPGYGASAAGLSDDKKIGPGGSKSAYSLEVTHNVPDSSASTITYTLMVNGVASAITVALLATSAGGESADVAVPLVATDRLSLRAVLGQALADGGAMNITVALRGV